MTTGPTRSLRRSAPWVLLLTACLCAPLTFLSLLFGLLCAGFVIAAVTVAALQDRVDEQEADH